MPRFGRLVIITPEIIICRTCDELKPACEFAYRRHHRSKRIARTPHCIDCTRMMVKERQTAMHARRAAALAALAATADSNPL